MDWPTNQKGFHTPYLDKITDLTLGGVKLEGFKKETYTAWSSDPGPPQEVNVNMDQRWGIKSITGLIGIPTSRAKRYTKANIDGNYIAGTPFYESREITITGYVKANHQLGLWKKWDQIKKVFRDAQQDRVRLHFNRAYDWYKDFTQQIPTGGVITGQPGMWTWVRQIGEVQVDLKPGGTYLEYSVTLTAQDPRLFWDILKSHTSSGIETGSWTGGKYTKRVTVMSGEYIEGTVPTWYYAQVHGPCKNPVFVFRDQNDQEYQLTIDYEVGAGDYIGIRMSSVGIAVRLNMPSHTFASDENLLDKVNWSISDFWQLLPGPGTSLRVYAETASSGFKGYISYHEATI